MYSQLERRRGDIVLLVKAAAKPGPQIFCRMVKSMYSQLERRRGDIVLVVSTSSVETKLELITTLMFALSAVSLAMLVSELSSCSFNSSSGIALVSFSFKLSVPAKEKCVAFTSRFRSFAFFVFFNFLFFLRDLARATSSCSSLRLSELSQSRLESFLTVSMIVQSASKVLPASVSFPRDSSIPKFCPNSAKIANTPNIALRVVIFNFESSRKARILKRKVQVQIVVCASRIMDD